MRVTVASDVAVHVVPAVLAVDGVTVVERHEQLDAAMTGAARHVIAAGETLAEVVTAVRGMYRRFGVDPTKTRPSSEALLRRLRKGDPLPRINSAVDVCNWCSVETQLPFGLYDAAAIEGDVTLRVGVPGEEYAGIRKDTVHVAGRLALVDARGPFGNPTSDSARTMVVPGATRLLFVIFAPRAAGAHVARHALELTTQRVLQFCGGTIAASSVSSAADAV
jgi:DNA/RNA-binding domain of Phe-tRNA-synthetase-like protein